MTEKTFETYSDYRDILNKQVIARILGVKKCPTDNFNESLISIRQQRVFKVLPESYYGYIYTPRIEICDEYGNALKLGVKYRGIDDNTYKTHPEIQRIVPRCYSIFIIFDKNDRVVARHILQGYYKFGGMAKDEDNHISTGLFEKIPLERATRVVITEKANGKAAVITMFKFKGNNYIFGGSKGDHYITIIDTGMKYLSWLNRNLFAYYILDVFFHIWEKMTEENKEILMEHLIGTENDDGYSICAEYEDGRHMVPLPLDNNGNITTDWLRMFGLVKNVGSITDKESLCEDVSVTLSWFKNLGLPYTKFYVKPAKELFLVKEYLREGVLKEGYVLHYQIKNSEDNYVTFAVEKYKLWWYIILRLLREFMRGKGNLDRRNWPKKLWFRLKSRNASYLKMDFIMLQKWYKILCYFVEWFFDKNYNDHLELIGFESGSLGMGTMWREFLYDYPIIDDTYKFVKDPVENAFKKLKNLNFVPSGRKNSIFAIFQGIPGLGKTTVSKLLIGMLRNDGISSIFIEQDVIVEKYGFENSGRLCYRECEVNLNERKYDVIFLVRNNPNFSSFIKYAKLAKTYNSKVIIFTPKYMLKTIHLCLVCIHSVYLRSFKKTHPTFKNLSIEKQISVTLSFMNKIKRIEESQFIDVISEIEWINPEAIENKMSIYLYKCVGDYLRKCIIHFCKEGENDADGNIFDMRGVLTGLRLDLDYQTWRKSSKIVATEITHNIINLKNSLKPPKNIEDKHPLVIQPSKSEMLYVGLHIDNNSRKILFGLLQYYNVDMTDLILTKVDHLTLIYENKEDRQGRKIWKELIPMAKNKQSLIIIVKGIGYWHQKLVCFSTEIRKKDNKNPNNGESMLRLCYSGMPHITVANTRDVAPVESIKLLKILKRNNDDAKDDKIFISIKENIVLEGIVKIYYS